MRYEVNAVMQAVVPEHENNLMVTLTVCSVSQSCPRKVVQGSGNAITCDLCKVGTSVGGRSQAGRLKRNTAMDDSIGGS